jgi:5'-3' exonuclease
VFYAPGEAEAAAAALAAAGAVDAVASPDGDTLLYGAETLLHTLRLSVGASVASG